ncbi:cellulase family glycosylhydrolase [Priestia aryabhattai]
MLNLNRMTSWRCEFEYIIEVRIIKKKYLIFIVFPCLISLFLLVQCNKKTDAPNNKKNESLELTSNLGINVHGSITENDIKMIKEAGFHWVRLDLTWANIETEKGVYDFEKGGYDKIHDILVKNGIHPYYILDYSNPIYEQEKSIVTETGREAFKNFVKATIHRYKDNGAVWEIWNEPNSSDFWRPQPSYEEYFLLVEEVAPVIKKEDKSSIVVAPALNGINEDSLHWLEATFKRGILRHIDAVSVHPYRQHHPETVVNDYAKVEQLIKEYSPRDIPVISGEWGYSMEHTENRREGELKQASYATRVMLINSWRNIPVSIWYNFRNDGNNLNNSSNNFGTLWSDNEPKLTYRAIKNLSSILKGYHYTKKIENGQPNDYIFKLSNKKGKEILVFWTSDTDHYVNINMTSGKGQLISMLGERQDIQWNQKHISLKLTSSPHYLIINNK